MNFIEVNKNIFLILFLRNTDLIKKINPSPSENKQKTTIGIEPPASYKAKPAP